MSHVLLPRRKGTEKMILALTARVARRECSDRGNSHAATAELFQPRHCSGFRNQVRSAAAEEKADAAGPRGESNPARQLRPMLHLSAKGTKRLARSSFFKVWPLSSLNQRSNAPLEGRTPSSRVSTLNVCEMLVFIE